MTDASILNLLKVMFSVKREPGCGNENSEGTHNKQRKYSKGYHSGILWLRLPSMRRSRVSISMDRYHCGPSLFSSFYVTVPGSSNLHADGLKDPAIKTYQHLPPDFKTRKEVETTHPNPPPPVPITHPGIWGCQWHSFTVSM